MLVFEILQFPEKFPGDRRVRREQICASTLWADIAARSEPPNGIEKTDRQNDDPKDKLYEEAPFGPALRFTHAAAVSAKFH